MAIRLCRVDFGTRCLVEGDAANRSDASGFSTGSGEEVPVYYTKAKEDSQTFPIFAAGAIEGCRAQGRWQGTTAID